MLSWPIPTIRSSHLSRFYTLYTFCLFITLLFAFLLPLCIPGRAFAATSPIAITSENATTVFAKNINFQVSVTDTDSAITQASITVTTKVPTYSQQTYDVSVNTPAQNLQLNWQDDISGSKFLFSGTPLMYSWMFHDRNDHWFTGSTQNITVIDSRFQWQHLSQGELQVYWYGQGTDFGQIVLSQALDNIKRISANLGGGPTSPITLWVYQSSDDFRGALPPNTFEWVGGLAYPPLNEAFVVVDSPNADTLVRDMPHELTHVIFHELVKLNDLVPTWFDEGLAVYNQTYHEPEMQQSFDDALKTHSLLPLDTLADGFPADSNKAYLAYAESWQFMSYMYNTFGIAKMAHLIHLMNNPSGAFEYEMTNAFGEDSTHIENQWLLSLNQPPILPSTQSTKSTTQPSNKAVVPLVTTTDASAPWLIGAGALLILLSLSGVSGLFVYQRRRTRFATQSITTTSEAQPVQQTSARPAYTPQLYIPPTPDAFEQYTQPTIPYLDAPGSFREEIFPPFTFGQEYKTEQTSKEHEGAESTQKQHQPYQAPQE
ncbi:MAG TPA: hypothetical protein DHW02_24700 [Ktedonobacter sp.]|nr:hypothetical protein [Ktedonobacter sp.]